MLTNIILYVFSFLIGTLGQIVIFISQGWHLPSAVFDATTYFFSFLMKFNIIVPMDQWLTALKWSIGFDAVYVAVRLVMKIFNYVRGSGGIEI
jgi:hypothetical protein